MNLLYDYQVFDSQIAGGISRYHTDLYKGCLNNGISSEIAIRYSDNIYLKDLNFPLKQRFSSEEKFLGGVSFKGKNYFYRFCRKIGLGIDSSRERNATYCRDVMRRNNYDIFHPTYYDDLYEDIHIHAPVILTIHDMIYESYPHFFGSLDTILKKKKWAMKSKAIIAISNYTKEEILRHYSFLKESDVHVVYHGIDLSDMSLFPINTDKKNYILFVGDRWAYKNFYRLLQAIKIVKNNLPEIKLYCVGRPFTKDELLYIDFLGINENIINKGRVSDTELITLYRNACMYVSTSLSEGFGLPLLECMKYGVPMLLSDIKVYREIAQDSAIYYVPLDEYSLAGSIIQLYNNRKQGEKMMNKGKERILLFDKELMVQNTLKVYNSI